EAWFGRLQIATACYMAFAHGANDVANAIGPVAGVLEALKGHVGSKAPVPAWVLFVGGAGIVAGLASYGYKVSEAVGRKITEVPPTRGFSAEFGTATTVLVCSLMGLPVSTTFVLVGSVMGVGFARGFGAIDLAVVRRIFLSWVITIPCSAALAALLFGLLRGGS
ncbi:MAG: inorganic phosphate transporter, partial [Planctomycetes bacterium]|nr:inorganic phosphate transporter [Planctomycetota bacterium]